ncbi:MAG: hypothetical protein JKY50_15050 [Oleispira sp.]|nr:hypothetical protein [Oleispira sp.]MBL4881740.1 hypothetical protein [Oleispira sp.]
MKHILHTIFAFSLIACGGSSSDDTQKYQVAMWDESSQRVQIIQDNGNVLNPNSRYVTYDFTLDSLSAKSKETLLTIDTISSPLTCAEDAVTYELIITDETGTDTSYLSNNKACNNIEGLHFIDIEEITLLIEKISEEFIFSDIEE